MPETHLTPEEQELLRSILRKRQPSSLWLVATMKEKPLNPAQRDNVKGVLQDELRDAGYGSDRAVSIKKLVDYFASL